MIRLVYFIWVVMIVFTGGVCFTYAQQNKAISSIAEENCSYIKTPVIAGEVNDFSAVVLVQQFLRTYESFPIDVTGVYDSATEAAVVEFQERYAMDILTPWGLTKPTGDVSVTTLHKMNEIYCGEGSSLNVEEKEQIFAIQKKYNVFNNSLSTTSSTTTSTSNTVKNNQIGRLAGTPIGFVNEVSLPILIMLFILMGTQTYFIFGFTNHPKMQLFPREIE